MTTKIRPSNLFGLTIVPNGGTLNIAQTATLTVSGTGGTLGSAAYTDSASYQPLITAGTTSQYYRGDKTWQTLDKTSVGLGNVDNTADANKSVSYAATAGSSNTEIGIGQTWQNVSGSRALGATYTNSTAKPIFISVILAYAAGPGGNGGSLWILIGGVWNKVASHNLNAYATTFTLTSIIPPGVSYYCDGTPNSGLVSWYELR